VAIAVVVLIVALLFVRIRMPEIMEEELVVERQTHTGKKLFELHILFGQLLHSFFM